MKAELIYRREGIYIKIYIRNININATHAQYAIDKLAPEYRASKANHPRDVMLNKTEEPLKIPKFIPGAEKSIDYISDISYGPNLKKYILKSPGARYYLSIKPDSRGAAESSTRILQASLKEQTNDIIQPDSSTVIVPFVPIKTDKKTLSEFLKSIRRFNMAEAYTRAAKEFYEKLVRYDRENDEWYKNPKEEDYGPPHYWPYADHRFEQLLEYERSRMKDFDWSEEYNAGKKFNSFEGEKRLQYEAFVEDWGLETPTGKPPETLINLEEMALSDDENYLIYKDNPTMEKDAIMKYYKWEAENRAKNRLH